LHKETIFSNKTAYSGQSEKNSCKFKVHCYMMNVLQKNELFKYAKQTLVVSTLF